MFPYNEQCSVQIHHGEGVGMVERGYLEGDLGTNSNTKTDEFSEKFRTACDPPSFSENHVADFFPKFMTEVPLQWQKSAT